MMNRHARLILFNLTMIVFLILGGLPQATLPVQAAAPALALGFSTEAVVSDLPSPTTVAWAPDGRMFIGQKDGRVRVVLNATSPSPTVLATDFIDISSEVNDYWDRGLLGIAVHPSFPTQPYIYLLYVYDPPPAVQNGNGQRVARLTRVTADQAKDYNVAVPGSETVLLGKNSTYANIANPDLVNGRNGQPSCDVGGVPVQDCLPTDSPSHSVGTVTFAPDGSLFASIGEGSQFSYTDYRALRAQNIDALSGKIFRINPDTGQGYPDNPFYDGNLDHNRSKVWDYGMRNPFRFTIGPGPEYEAYIGDIGWNTWEELNVGKGKNFGWPCYEGDNLGSVVQPSYSSNITTENFCASVYSGGGFPATPVLDSFDRPDGGIGKWTGATSGYQLASNLLDVGSGGDIFRAIQYGPNQEAFLSFTTLDPNATELGVLLKSASKTASTSGALKVIYDPTHQRVQVWTYTGGQGWTQRGANIPVTFANGDVLGTRALADGSVRLYRNGVLLGTVDVKAWPQYAAGGFIGLTATNAGSAVYNDFGGGTAVLVNPADLKAPVWAYDHHSGDASIQANVFYTGSVYPAQYQGALFIEDYSRNWIKYVTFDAGGAATVHDFADAVAIVGGPVHMSQGPDGLLYYVAYNGTTASEIRRIRYTAGNTPPTAFASSNPTSGIAPLMVAFSSAGSFDPEAQPITFSWNFGDGSSSSSDPNPSHTFNAPANTIVKVNVVLTVTDSKGASNTASVLVTVGDTAPVPHITVPAQGAKYNVGDSINFSGSATDAEDGALPGSSLQWSVLLHHHTHVHFDYFSASGTSGSFIAPDHGDDTHMELCLAATDKSGLSGKTCIDLFPNTVVYTLQSIPSGLQLLWEGIAYTTPFTVTTIVNAQEQLIAPPTQASWKFSHWSDGGDQTHTITIQAAPQTFTAFYSAPYSQWMPIAGKH